MNENNEYKIKLKEEMNNMINELKTKNEEIKKDFEKKSKDLENLIQSNNVTINNIQKFLFSKFNTFLVKISFKDRKPMNVLLTNNHILDKNDIKIGSKIIIKCEDKEKIIEIKDYRFTFTNKYLNYTCIQIFSNEFEDSYFNEKHYSTIKINKILNNNILTEFKDINIIYRDIEKNLSLDNFFQFHIPGNRKLYYEINELSRIKN